MKRLKSIDPARNPKVVCIRPGVSIPSESEDEPMDKIRWVTSGLASGGVRLIRYLLFASLLWLRLPVKLLAGIVSLMTVVGLLMSLLLFSNSDMVGGLVIMGLISSSFSWAYDLILTKLDPAN